MVFKKPLFSFCVLCLIVVPVVFVIEVFAHEPDGPCHRPYDNPNDCYHPCDHIFCKCVRPCDAKCRISKDENCYNKCAAPCFREHVKCYEKCDK